jgi:hypothetical protein
LAEAVSLTCIQELCGSSLDQETYYVELGFLFFPQLSTKILGFDLKLGCDGFLLHHFQFIQPFNAIQSTLLLILNKLQTNKWIMSGN